MNVTDITSKTFGDYCNTQITNKIKQLAQNVSRLDVVFDVYKKTTLKQDTRDGRGKSDGIRIPVRNDTPIQPKIFSKCLKIDENKTELFTMISDSISSMTSNTTEILCTKLSHVVSNTRSLTDNLQPCSQEEADTRLLLHVRDIASSGLRKIMIIASDTDVVVIALYIFHSLFIEELWIKFGAGKPRWLPIHRYGALLGE